MDANQLWETTMDPERRKLRQITIEDMVEANRITDLLMGKEVEPRKKWIIENAEFANIDV